MKKLPKWLLKWLTLENKNKLKSLISSWDKESIKNTIFQILEKKEDDVNTTMKEVFSVENTFDSLLSKLIISNFLNNIKHNDEYARHFLFLITNKLITDIEIKKYSTQFADNIFWDLENIDEVELNLFISLIEKWIIDKNKYQIQLNNFFNHILCEMKIYSSWNHYIEKLVIIIENELVDKNYYQEDIEKTINHHFLEKYYHDSVFQYYSKRKAFITLYNKWYIDENKYKKYIDEILKHSEKEAEYDFEQFDILLTLVKDGLAYNSNSKDNILLSKFKDFKRKWLIKKLINLWINNYKWFHNWFTLLVKSWLLDNKENNKKIKNIVNAIIENITKKDYYEANAFVLLKEHWLIDKKEYSEEIQKVISLFKKSNNDRLYMNMLIVFISYDIIDNTTNKKEIEEIKQYAIKYTIEKKNIKILNLLIEKKYINPNSKEYKIFFNWLFKKIKKEILDTKLSWNTDFRRRNSLTEIVKLYDLLTLQKTLVNEINPDYIKNIKLVEEISLTFRRKINIFNTLKERFSDLNILEEIKQFIDNWYIINKRLFEENIEKILTHPKWFVWWYFMELLKNGEEIDKYIINEKNFLNFMNNNDILFTFEKDQWFKGKWNTPWTKAWFLEDIKRINYLKIEKLRIFEKFWTTVWEWNIKWIKKHQEINEFYEYILNNISLNKSRKSILQLWEVFALILRKEEYEILDNLTKQKEISIYFKKFIEKYNISDKWRTILILMIVNEINSNLNIIKNIKWEQQINSTWIRNMLSSIYIKLQKYEEIIKIFNNPPIKTSIWVEIEVTENIAKWYKEQTWSNYKEDIIMLSEFAWIGEWKDAIHEIATNPTDNPYLLLLELKILKDLDFLDLNFKKENYIKWARWLHITIWWEKWIKLNEYTIFIQNILIASNLWWLNTWKEIDKINNHNCDIKEKHAYTKKIFNEEKNCVEYRNFSIDKSEPFERLILAIFTLNMVYQIWIPTLISFENFSDFRKVKNIERFKKYIYNNLEKNYSNEEKDKYFVFIYDFINLIQNIIEIINNHNKNFEKNESILWKQGKWFEKIITLFNSNSPVTSIMKEIWIDIDYFKNIKKIDTIESFIHKLRIDWKKIDTLTTRQQRILFSTYNLKIEKYLKELKKQNKSIYKKISEYLNWDIDDIIRKITNKKRFESVINWDKKYLQNLTIPIEQIFEMPIEPDVINKFIKINNLFIKKDSSNALSSFNTTIEPDWEKIFNSQLTETTIFDKLDLWLKERKWYNLIQWASKSMLTQAIQIEILKFTYKVINELKNNNENTNWLIKLLK